MTLLPVTNFHETRDVNLIDGQLVPDESSHRRMVVLDLAGKSHEVQVNEETFSALLILAQG